MRSFFAFAIMLVTACVAVPSAHADALYDPIDDAFDVVLTMAIEPLDFNMDDFNFDLEFGDADTPLACVDGVHFSVDLLQRHDELFVVKRRWLASIEHMPVGTHSLDVVRDTQSGRSRRT